MRAGSRGLTVNGPQVAPRELSFSRNATGLRQGRTVIFMGRLGWSRFGVTNGPTELEKVAKVSVVVRGQACTPLRYVKVIP